jgi:hypothetical protein
MTVLSRNRTRICGLNNQCRTGGLTGDGLWVITRGVRALGADFVACAVRKVQAFDRFDADNDPYGEHDFGAFSLCGERLFWKIDCYDRALAAGSPNPADPDVTVRVLTLMLASEY